MAPLGTGECDLFLDESMLKDAIEYEERGSEWSGGMGLGLGVMDVSMMTPSMNSPIYSPAHNQGQFSPVDGISFSPAWSGSLSPAVGEDGIYIYMH